MSHKVREILVVSFFMLLFTFFASKGLWIGITGVLVLFAATFLLSPERCIMVLFLCYFFKFTIPVQVFGWRLLYQWVIFFWVGINILQISLSKGHIQEPLPRYLKRAKTCAYLFLAALGSVILIRGAGFYRFGGNVIGGGQYVMVILMIFALLFSFRFVPSDRAWKRLTVMFIASSFFMFFIQYLIARGAFGVRSFFDVTAMGLALEEEGISGVATAHVGRYVSLTHVSVSLLGIASIFWGKGKTPLYFIFVLFAVVIAALSGYRRALLSLPMILSLFHLVHTKNKKKVLFVVALVGGLALVSAYFLAPYLPFNVQRALAVLPGIGVEHAASHAAKASSDWRIEIWAYCLEELPRYLLLGKGALLSVADTIQNLGELATLGHQTDVIFRAHSYHSFLLSMLLDLGLPATLAYIGLVVYLGRYFFSLKKRLHGVRYAVYCLLLAVWINQQLHQLYTTGLLAIIVSNLLFALFLLIVGSKADDGDATEGESCEILGSRS
ncbi:MAG: O-antigen ligase family protein [Pontiella sp.]